MNLDTLKSWAIAACNDLGGKPENWLAIATQWIQEKGYPWWEEGGQPPFNVGNVRYVSGQFKEFPDMNAGVWGYIHFLQNDPAEYYIGVLHALRTGTNDDVLSALSKSPYCSPPYSLQELQSILDHLEIFFGIQSVKTPAKPDTKPDTKPEEARVTQTDRAYITVTRTPPYNTLWGISLHTKGDGRLWRELLPLNPGIKPWALQIGQKVRVK